MVRLSLLVAAVLLGVSCGKHVDLKWSDCALPGSHGRITAVDITPFPPVLGQNCTLTGHAILDKAVSDGQMTLKATFAGLPIPVNPSSLPACGDTIVRLPLNLGTITIDGLQCPQAAGNASLTEVVLIPEIAPLGTYEAQLTGVDQDGEPTVCVKLHIVVTA
jgi:hypothetical protein